MQTARFQRPKIIFSDFDGTLTDHTEFSSVFLDILRFCQNQGVPFIIVTGRSVSWAHFLLTHFSALAIIIAEGGGILVSRDPVNGLINQPLIPATAVERLAAVTADLTQQYPELQLSADSLGRLTDRALELSVLQQNPTLYKAVCQTLTAAKVHYSTSNVHLNFWCGELSKYQAILKLLQQYYPQCNPDETVFFGDSLNDQSVFKDLAHTVGVANIDEVLEQMTHTPAIILKSAAHRGPAGVLSYLQQLFN